MVNDELKMQQRDIDPEETQEWLESFDSIVERQGIERAYFILTQLLSRAQIERVELPALLQTPYINSIPPEREPGYPGDEDLERKIRRYIRWNAAVMVVKANKNFSGIGGHLSTYASAATLLEVGFNHIFRGKDRGLGDQVFFQGHASPGIYARAFLEGRISMDQMLHFRREVVPGQGLSSYPHPWLMPNFWEFPTVSMGLGPMAAIYQARFNRYAHSRGLADTSESRVWAFLGDGECDEPETLGCLHVAAHEKLSNLKFVINCNLQRLDGPVRGNGKIIQELEATFKGAGWRVIKVVWGREWDPLLSVDEDGVLIRRMGEAVDGDFQKYSVESGEYIRRHFFGQDPRLLEMVQHLTDRDLQRLRRGGHDFRKMYAAYRAAEEESERPTVILAKTVKGWTLGGGAEGRNVAHQAKKLSYEELKAFRDRLYLDIPDAQLEDPPFLTFQDGSREQEYLLERRRALGGFVPERRRSQVAVDVPEFKWFERFLKGSGDQEASTTGVFARILAQLLGHKGLGKLVVPIIPDEARTFGLDALFRRYGIYSAHGQKYEPVDAAMLLSYREAEDGQVLEEGICEAGAMASFIAAGSSYCTLRQPTIPFYIFYSMFGFQRTGDQIWAAGDQRVRGFLIGATFGRTALNGEGLQHQDGHSHLIASTNPSVKAYDPAYAYEVATIIHAGMHEMYVEDKDVIYYVSVHNDSHKHPPMPEGVEEGILAGAYRLMEGPITKGPKVQLLGSGCILEEVLKAKDMLAEHWDVSADVWSVTSYNELRREALECERWNLLHPKSKAKIPKATQIFADATGPVIAVSDNMTALPDQISRWVDNLYALGTDGFGRSDTREALRRHFEVDGESITVAALSRLASAGEISNATVTKAMKKLGVDPNKVSAALA